MISNYSLLSKGMEFLKDSAGKGLKSVNAIFGGYRIRKKWVGKKGFGKKYLVADVYYRCTGA